MGQDDIRDSANALAEWLDIQAYDDSGEMMFTEEDIDDLRAVILLASAHAPDAELRMAVHRAREVGWGWPPLALSLGISVPEARHRYESRPAHQSAHRWWFRLRAQLKSGENQAVAALARCHRHHP
jgi:hypothetical protein